MNPTDLDRKARELHIAGYVAEGSSLDDATIICDVPCPSNRATRHAITAALRLAVPEDAAIAAAFREIGKCSYAQDGIAGELFGAVRKKAAEILAAAPTLADEGDDRNG